MPPPHLRFPSATPTKPLSLHRLLLPFSSSYFSSRSRPKPKWNSNHNLIVTNPTLSLMESCDSMAELKQIQAHMTRTGLISHRFPVSRALAFCALSDSGNMAHATLLFSQFPNPNTYMWNTMIRGSAKSRNPRMGLSYFSNMIRGQVEMDGRTIVFVVKACEQFAGIFEGQEAHCLICKMGFGSELLIQNALMHLYVKHGELVSARKVFDGMGERDVVSWTTMIDGYSQKGLADASLKLFYLMLFDEVQPNEITMIAVFSTCSHIGILSLGRSIHEYIEKGNINTSTNLLNAAVDMYGKCGCVQLAREVFDQIGLKDVFSWTSMMNAYAKCGDIDLARKFFDEMPEKNEVSWSCMIGAYSQANQPKEALNLFHEMIAANVKPIVATLVSVLSACAQNGCLDLGRWIYSHYIVEKKIMLTINLANAFIDMYAKCGAIDLAAKMFYEMPERDVVSWNSIITGYAVHGYGHEALNLFRHFESMGLVPDDVTFVGVLSACSHIGLVAEGRKHFEHMNIVYGIEPKTVHYACLIDLLGRVGLIDDAYELVRSMPKVPDEAGWGALLNACRMHGNVELGKCAGDKLLGLDPGDSGTYMLLSNMYAAGNRWDDVKRVRMMMRDKGVIKTPGCSSIEIDGEFHEFFVADHLHSLSKDIYIILDLIYIHLRCEGYTPIHDLG